MKTFIKVFLWLIGGIVALWIAINLLVTLMFTESQDLTSVSYYFSIQKSDYPSLLGELILMEEKNNFILKYQGHQLNSHNVTWVDEKKSVRITLDSVDLNGKTDIAIAIIAKEPRNNKLWETSIKFTESVLLHFTSSPKTYLQLDSAIYGKCSSSARPTMIDTYCSFDLSAPVNMKETELLLMKPREK